MLYFIYSLYVTIVLNYNMDAANSIIQKDEKRTTSIGVVALNLQFKNLNNVTLKFQDNAVNLYYSMNST